MSADASSSIVSLRRRSLFVAMFALAACESDPTPIVNENGDGSLSLAPTNSPGGRGGPGIGGRDPELRLRIGLDQRGQGPTVIVEGVEVGE